MGRPRLDSEKRSSQKQSAARRTSPMEPMQPNSKRPGSPVGDVTKSKSPRPPQLDPQLQSFGQAHFDSLHGQDSGFAAYDKPLTMEDYLTTLESGIPRSSFRPGLM